MYIRFCTFVSKFLLTIKYNMMMTLNEIQNANGGGLSTLITGKYTSVRHEKAKLSGKITAGEAAKILSKSLNIKVSAKEIVNAFKLLNGTEPEWHHAGFYKGSTGSTMGRTFFFSNDEINHLAGNWNKVNELFEKQANDIKIKEETTVQGFYYEWDYNYSGRYGKKVNFKILKTFQGSELSKPRNFTPCNDSQFENAKSKENKKYYGWDEPELSEF